MRIKDLLVHILIELLSEVSFLLCDADNPTTRTPEKREVQPKSGLVYQTKNKVLETNLIPEE
jgi:hypothetical protein